MSGERPTAESLRRGITVEIEQTNAENAPDAAPIRGEIETVIDEDNPEGVEVKLVSGVTGYVTRIVAED